MKKKPTYHEIIDIRYEDASLTVRIVELVDGEPDGGIGIPLVVGADSRRYTIHFKGVTEFRSKAEPCYDTDSERTDISEFLWEDHSSDYVDEACSFGEGAKDPARHFCVYTESVVVEVLSSHEPRIEIVRGRV